MNAIEPDIQAAPDELLALAAALLAARQAGRTWDRTLVETVRLMRVVNGSPWDLKRAAADPFHRSVPPPGTEKRGAAKARQLLGYDQSADADWYDPNSPDVQFCPGCRIREHCDGGTSFCECDCTTSAQAGAAS